MAKAAVQVKATTAQVVTLAKQGDVCELDPSNARTLGQAIRNAGWDPGNVTDVRVNNKKVKSMETKLKAGDQVTLLGKIAGA